MNKVLSAAIGFLLVFSCIHTYQEPVFSQTPPAPRASSPENVAPNPGCSTCFNQQANGSCSPRRTCPSGQVMNTSSPSCSCICPTPSTPCTSPHQTNPTTCACECPSGSSTCSVIGQIFDPLTCSCNCVGNRTNSNGLCCPSTEVRVGTTSTCCVSDQIVRTGASTVCCPASRIVQHQSNGTGICCPSNQQRAGGSRSGGVCCDISKIAGSGNTSSCCSATQTPVSGSCCDTSRVTNGGSVCCPAGQSIAGSGASAVCCAPEQIVSGGICASCPPGQTKIPGTNICCDPAQIAGSACCSSSQAPINGTCCPASRIVGGNTCCPVGQQRAGGSRSGGVCCNTANIVGSGNTSSCCDTSRITNGGSVCCPAGQAIAGSGASAVCCAPEQIVSGGICASCPPGQTKIPGTNICCDPAQIAGSACCSSSQAPINGTCCPASRIVGGNTCCPVGQQRAGGSRSGGVCCVTSRVSDSGSVCCPDSKVIINGVCSCPSGQTSIGGTCCPNNRVVGSGATATCCPAGQGIAGSGSSAQCCSASQTPVGNSCCDTSRVTNGGSVCCPSGQDVAGSGASAQCCAAGQIKIDGTNICCNPDKVAGSSCCPGSQAPINGTCCPANRIVGGTCCPVGQQRAGGVCCVTSRVSDSGSVCCPDSKVIINGVCSCPSGQTSIGGTCCPNNRVIGSGATATCCPAGQEIAGSGSSAQCCASGLFAASTGSCESCISKVKLRYGLTADTGNGVNGYYKYSQTEAFSLNTSAPECLTDTLQTAWDNSLVPGCRITGAKFPVCDGPLTSSTDSDFAVRNALVNLLPSTTSRNCNFSNFAQYCSDVDCGAYNTRADCVYGDIYFDSQCRPVTDTDLTKPLCDVGTVSWRQSPISLLLDGSKKINLNRASVVNFPLDPRKPEMSSVWYASELAPLLVYDPEHTGKITNANQLFGNWTFGGIKEASLDAMINGSKVQKPWKDGFEALASLDTNNDEKISGAELSALGLWFDKNRNGISETGEVKDINDTDVVALYYKTDETESISKNIYAYKGFDRLVDGKIVTGTAVDWYASTSEAALELALGETVFTSNGTKDTPSKAETPFAKDAPQNPENNETKDTPKFPAIDSLGGIWNWKSTVKPSGKSKNENIAGTFIFLDDDLPSGYFIGHSILEVRLLDAQQNEPASISRVMSFNGVKAKKNKKNIEFTLVDKEGALIKNTATISKDGQTMTGKSIILKNVSNDVGEKYSYTWTAKRYKK